MCILPAGCKRLGKKALTVTEVIVVLIIIGIAATIGTGSWQRQIEGERETNAKAVLRVLWQSEESFFAWKNAYTQDWNSLAIQNPNATDKFYAFTIDDAAARTLSISAKRKGGGKNFKIDQNGIITQF